jgi:hypothetical protein
VIGYQATAAFCYGMVFSLVTEGQIPVLDELLRLPRVAQLTLCGSGESQQVVQRQWRQSILRGLVEARAYWAPSTAPLDISLVTYLKWYEYTPPIDNFTRTARVWTEKRCVDVSPHINP